MYVDFWLLIRTLLFAEHLCRALHIENIVLNLKPGQLLLKSPSAASCSPEARSVARAPITTLASIRAPVLWACMVLSCSRLSSVAVAARSMAWPVTIPPQPLRRESRAISSITVADGISPARSLLEGQGLKPSPVGLPPHQTGYGRGLARTQVIVIHCWQIIVDQRVGVNHLHGSSYF